MMPRMAQDNIWLTALAVLVAALPMPTVQSVGYPAYAERFPIQARYTGMAIAGVLNDHQQTNLVIVPQARAYALMLLCLRNPKVCPILAVENAGDPRVPLSGAAIDIRTVLPRYQSSFSPKFFHYRAPGAVGQ